MYSLEIVLEFENFKPSKIVTLMFEDNFNLQDRYIKEEFDACYSARVKYVSEKNSKLRWEYKGDFGKARLRFATRFGFVPSEKKNVYVFQPNQNPQDKESA